MQSYIQENIILNENKRVSIIIPAYNEEKRIQPVLQEICRYIEAESLPWNVLVSIDGNDGTEKVVKGIIQRYPFVSYLKGNGRSGKGGAIKRAVNIASGEFVMLMDADNAVEFEAMLPYVRLLDRYDLINFDRYSNNGNYIPKLRRFVSRGYNFYIKLLLGLKIRDTQCGYKIMKTESVREVFRKLTITNGFFYSPLFFYLQSENFNMIEVPINYNHSEGSKFSVASMVLGGFISAMAFRIRNSPLWKYVPKKLVDLYYKKFRWI